jgi:ADP-heptose:LPS heptosyltransferase
MSWKRSILEAAVWSAAQVASGASRMPRRPRSIFVLRNNDIGDLLVVTPLFDALRRRFPDAHIVAGVGQWNVEILRGNPHLSDVMVVNAPWHNRSTGTRDPRVALRYIATSPEVADLRRRRFDVGIDVLGSAFGSLLLMRAGIPWRIGVKGYAGGQSGVQQSVTYDPAEHVGRSALRFAELLGTGDLPSLRPQVFLSRAELDDAERIWQAHAIGGRRRVVIAPGGGHPGRAWGVERFVELGRLLSEQRTSLAVVGAPADAAAGAALASSGALDLTGKCSLRQTIAVISRADLLLCNSSFAMHAAAAAGVRAIVLLGELYESARAHAAQWGHGSVTQVLGHDGGRAGVFEPPDVMRVVTRGFGQSVNPASALMP